MLHNPKESITRINGIDIVELMGAALFVALVGIAGTIAGLRCAVGNYRRDDAFLGLSPENLTYSFESGVWTGAIGVAVVVLLYFIRFRKRALMSAMVAFVVVVGVVLAKWFWWAATTG